jgi:hypothetical protein
MKRTTVILILLCLASASTHAQWRQEGKEVPDAPWRRTVQGFGAMLVFTNEPDAFFEAWSRPPSPDYKPAISSPDEVRRGDTVVAVIVFTNCRGNKRGNCDAEVDFTLFRPDGSVYAKHKKADLWRGTPAPPEHNLQLGVSNLGFRVEPEDPLGEYRLEAVVRDKIAKITVPLVQVITVLPAS